MKYVYITLGIVIGSILTYVELHDTKNTSPSTIQDVSVCSSYSHISDTACLDPIIKKVPYATLKEKLETYIQTQKAAGTLTEIGFYFRDLNNGPTLGINEHAEFVPASMMKTAVLIGYLDLATSDPTVLDITLSIAQADFDALMATYSQNYAPIEVVKPETPYTVKDLLQRSITYSDNIASEMLNMYLENTLSNGTNMLVETFRALGLMPNVEITDFVLSTKRYAQVFSTLYYSAYLAPAQSEYALELLTHTQFAPGLVAGVPNTVTVAHKFGERTIYPREVGEKETRQLHDCGIIYYPQNPYLLCVMTRGERYEDLEQTIHTISEMVYREVDSRRILNAPSTHE